MGAFDSKLGSGSSWGKADWGKSLGKGWGDAKKWGKKLASGFSSSLSKVGTRLASGKWGGKVGKLTRKSFGSIFKTRSNVSLMTVSLGRAFKPRLKLGGFGGGKVGGLSAEGFGGHLTASWGGMGGLGRTTIGGMGGAASFGGSMSGIGPGGGFQYTGSNFLGWGSSSTPQSLYSPGLGFGDGWGQMEEEQVQHTDQHVYVAIRRYVAGRIERDQSAYREAQRELETLVGKRQADRLLNMINGRQAIPERLVVEPGWENSQKLSLTAPELRAIVEWARTAIQTRRMGDVDEWKRLVPAQAAANERQRRLGWEAPDIEAVQQAIEKYAEYHAEGNTNLTRRWINQLGQLVGEDQARRLLEIIKGMRPLPARVQLQGVNEWGSSWSGKSDLRETLEWARQVVGQSEYNWPDWNVRKYKEDIQWRTSQQVASQMGAIGSVYTARRLADEGEIKSTKVGGMWFFDWEDAQRYQSEWETKYGPEGQYWSTERASQETGYSSGWLSHLARHERVEAHKMGGQWYFSPGSFEEYKKGLDSEPRIGGESPGRTSQPTTATTSISDLASTEEQSIFDSPGLGHEPGPRPSPDSVGREKDRPLAPHKVGDTEPNEEVFADWDAFPDKDMFPDRDEFPEPGTGQDDFPDRDAFPDRDERTIEEKLLDYPEEDRASIRRMLEGGATIKKQKQAPSKIDRILG